MPSLTIGGQEYVLELRNREIGDADDRQIQRGGRPLIEILQPPSTNGDESSRKRVSFGLPDLEVFWWAGLHRKLGEKRPQELLEQFYGEGGTIWDLHDVVVNALIDGGLLGRRAPPGDPPEAGASAASGTSSPS
jgi:hypothetical protein